VRLCPNRAGLGNASNRWRWCLHNQDNREARTCSIQRYYYPVQGGL